MIIMVLSHNVSLKSNPVYMDTEGAIESFCIKGIINHKDFLSPGTKQTQDAKKVSFAACHLGKVWLACTSPQVISTSPKILFD